MLLIVIIDNFEIKFYLINSDSSINSSFLISSKDDKTIDQYISEIRGVFDEMKIEKNDILHTAIISDIQKFENIVIETLEKYLKIKPYIISEKDILNEMQSLVNINEIAISILVVAYSGMINYGKNVLVVNFDHFISFCMIIDGKLIGYNIYPGLEMLSNIIHNKTSIFPDIMIKSTDLIVGQNKYDAINSGLFNGCLGACDRIINGIIDLFPKKEIKIIATGKDLEIFAQYSSKIQEKNSNLMLNGIIEISKKSLIIT